MKKIIFLLVLVFVTRQLTAQQNTIQKQKWHWRNEQDTSAGYAQVLKIDNVLYISGTVSKEITPEGIKNVYSALEKSLQQFGATFHNVVKENLYTTDIEAMKKYNDTRKVFYKGDFPAATWVQINRLFNPDAKLEVELIAHLPK
ncbi:MAG: RidA family protein [Chitinophagaceae bacterium]